MRSLFIPAAAIAMLAQLVILRSVIAGRAPASSPGRIARLAEIAWVILPTVALIAVLVMTWRQMASPIALAPISGVQV